MAEISEEMNYIADSPAWAILKQYGDTRHKVIENKASLLREYNSKLKEILDKEPK